MREADLNLQLKTPGDTEALGAALARSFSAVAPAMTREARQGGGYAGFPRDGAESDAAKQPVAAGHGAVLHLRGELGAGKTTLVRSFLRALGIAGLVRSPTYTLVEPYLVDRAMFVHVDLYRLRSPGDLDDLGLRDYSVPGNLLLIEWPERGGPAVPPPDLDLQLRYEDAGRAVSLLGRSSLGHFWLEKLGRDTSLLPYLSNLT